MPEISPTIIWACVGIALIVIEVFTTTFFLLFFGVAALIVSVIKVFGLADLPTELIIFAIAGLAGTLIFRKKIVRSLASKTELEIDKDQVITVTADIPAGETGSVMYRGSPWKAFNDSPVDLKKGDDAVIKKVEGIRLILVPK
ncbi:MAG: hypothetical protein HQM16_03300 [Deltaproteobacteria bacterium]|nr:hypothetical protein [Deltaproteobacteria bacterium]